MIVGWHGLVWPHSPAPLARGLVGPFPSLDAPSSPWAMAFAHGSLWVSYLALHPVNSYVPVTSQPEYFFREFFLYSRTREVPYDELLELLFFL